MRFSLPFDRGFGEPPGMPNPFRVVNIDCNFDYPYERDRLAPLGIELVLRKAVTEDEIIAACVDADAVFLEGTKTPMNARVIGALPPRCRLIAKYAVGVDNVDVAAATRAGIVVANAADFCTEEVSDHAVALILAAARQVVSLDRHVHAGRWTGFVGTRPLRRMSELTLGFVGLGRIARATVRKMSGFRMRLIASDPYLQGASPEAGVTLMPFDQVLAESDIVSVHVPLSSQTRCLINEAALRQMKPTSLLVNTSRGPIVDEAALVRALREKWIAGAALDVVEVEPLPADSPLRDFDQVILTPHRGADSVDSLAHVRRTMVESVVAVAQGFWPPFTFNPQVTPRVALRPLAEAPRF